MQDLTGLLHIVHTPFYDIRGSFIKCISEDIFAGREDFKESYFSTSKKQVLRGMHFQTNEYAHSKLVTIVDGSIMDVALNINPESRDFGKFNYYFLTSKNPSSLLMSMDYAHGFLTLSDAATVLYHTTTYYNKEADTGILWSSFGFNWSIENPVISERDGSFKTFQEYINENVNRKN